MSTLKVNAIESQAADSAPTIAGLQFPTAGPLSNRNLIINGAMNVAQRGTSDTSSGYGTVDRFSCGFSGGAQTQTQHTLTNSTDATVWDLGFRRSVRIANTTTSTIASSFRRITYLPEAQDIASSGWDYENPNSSLTLSFWVRASVSQQYTCCIYTSDGTTQAYTFAIQDDGGSTLSANTWTKITHTIPGNANIQVDNNNGSGMQIDFVAWWGTDFTGTKAFNSWGAFGDGSDRTADMTNTWATTTDATFEITGVQLEVGDKATPFEHRSYGDELAKCQRYYYRWNSTQNSDVVCDMNCWGTDMGLGQLVLPTSMRAVPDLSVSATTDFIFSVNSNDLALTGISRNRANTESVQIFASGSGWSGLSAGDGGFLRDDQEHPSFMEFEAEL